MNPGDRRFHGRDHLGAALGDGKGLTTTTTLIADASLPLVVVLSCGSPYVVGASFHKTIKNRDRDLWHLWSQLRIKCCEVDGAPGADGRHFVS
jgi:hypothetical protein